MSFRHSSGMQNSRYSDQFLAVLRTVLMVLFVYLVYPSISLAQEPILPTERIVKPAGTAETNIALWLPEGAVTEPFLPVADYIAEEDLPEGVSYPADIVGSALTFGLWSGDSTTLRHFNPSIVINLKYQDSDVPSTILDREEQLHLMIYNPATQSWNKLCSSIDIYENVISAALSTAIPLDGKGGSLLAIAADDTPPLDQVVDAQGTTTLSLKGSTLGFEVLFDTVEVGSHFAVTVLPSVLDSGPVKLFSRPIDLKGCQIDHTRPDQSTRELSLYPKPLKIGFNYDSDTLSRVSGKSNLTIVNLNNNQWIDQEALGSRIIRGDKAITVDTLTLGTFSIAAR